MKEPKYLRRIASKRSLFFFQLKVEIESITKYTKRKKGENCEKKSSFLRAICKTFVTQQ